MALACSFRVINQRRPLLFYFFNNATVANGFFNDATLAAASDPIPFKNYNEPTQVHLALTKSQGCCPDTIPPSSSCIATDASHCTPGVACLSNMSGGG